MKPNPSSSRWSTELAGNPSAPIGATPDDAVVELRGVGFRWPGQSTPTLEKVDLRLGRDAFLGIVGPNGAGKSTLLKLMLGLLEPEQGEVRVFGEPPEKVRGRIGYVPQHARIDPSVPADALDVVLLGRLGLSSWGPFFRRADREAALEALALTGTADLAKRPIRSLSGGQRQRVLIARALVGSPELLLLDEPTTGIDVHREKELLELLLELNHRLPIVMVSHDLTLVSEHLKTCAFVNRRLTVHPARELSLQKIEDLYHPPKAS